MNGRSGLEMQIRDEALVNQVINIQSGPAHSRPTDFMHLKQQTLQRYEQSKVGALDGLLQLGGSLQKTS